MRAQQIKCDKLNICGQAVTKLKMIGEGNFSQVFFAETATGKSAAVKKIKKSGKDKTSYQLAKKEAAILANLNSATICQLLGTFEENNYYYLIEKFQQGQTLDLILKKKKRLQLNEAEVIFKGILRGMEYLISQRVMHRDLKPSNIICSDSYQPVLIDFGFACLLGADDSATLSERIGTPFYMSPEMLNRKRYNSKSDIWSLGVIFHEMVCGYLPFFGANDGDLLKDIMMNREKLFKGEKTVPERLKRVINKCLTVDMQERISWDQLFSEFKMTSSMFARKEIIYEEGSVCSSCCGGLW